MKFRLQSVLDYRQNLEHQARRDLAEVLDRESVLCRSIEKEKGVLDALYAGLVERQREGIAPHELLLYHNRIRQGRDVLGGLAEQLKGVRAEVEEKRTALREAGQEKLLLEKLKEKREREWERQIRFRETLILDEIALSRIKR